MLREDDSEVVLIVGEDPKAGNTSSAEQEGTVIIGNPADTTKVIQETKHQEMDKAYISE